jgi:hypothetical protein
MQLNQATYPILPTLPRLVHKGLDYVFQMSGKLVITDWFTVVTKSFVEESIPESS